jgi:DNA-binding transcriptional ArsR family regulator
MVTDDVFAVIAEATRRDILVSLRSGDKAVGELVEELDASQPTISKHLKVLREADLVSMRAQGQKRYYALNPKPLAGIASWLETFDVGPRAAVVSSPSALLLEAKTDTAVETATAPAETAPAPVPAAAGSVRPGTGEVPGRSAGGQLSPAVAIPVAIAGDDSVPQQIGRTVGRAATKAADLIANLPKFGRKK